MVPFLQLYLNSVNNTPCPRVYTLLRLCSSLCFATKGMSVVAATNVVVDPPLATEERKRKNLLARRFLFHRALLAGLLLPFSLFTRRIFEGVSPRLVAWPDFQPSSPVLGAAFLYCLVEISSILTRIDSTRERDREGRREERGVEIGTGLEIILILVRARNYLLGIAVIRNNGWCEIFGFFWTRKIEISTRFQDFGIF